jgi:beta-1,4-mannosyl-glycoprotein beta-1,4-N-acetylglucosaminyltransferase
MIIDCFTFYNELELLEIRLEELKDVVDWFILVEAGETYSGKPKELVFEANHELFNTYPIKRIAIPRFPSELTSAWSREEYSRNTLAIGLQELGLKPSDIIMLSDIDEIPRADVVSQYAYALSNGHVGPCCVLNQSLCYYFVNCVADDPWQGTRMIPHGFFSSFPALRAAQGENVPNAGWHFSYLGGIDRVREKIGASIHTELDLPKFTDQSHLERCIDAGIDVFGRDLRFHFTPLDESYPKYLLDNRQKFKDLIHDVCTSPSAEQLFRTALQTPSDINQHIDFLYRLASTVNHITEFGTRFGGSTCAFIYAKPRRLVAYDIEPRETLPAILSAARECRVDFEFREQDVLKSEIEPTDLLFIDTWHVEQQMREELRLHADKVRLYLVMHDTETFAHGGESNGHQGIWPAIADYMKEHPEWRLLHHFQHNNGLTVFTRISPRSETE